MQHITYAEKTLFVDDETAETLVEYAALLGSEQQADTVSIAVVGEDGNEAIASFVLNSGTSIMAETTNSPLEPPKNEEAVEYMRARMEVLRYTPQVTAEEPGSWTAVEDF